ncbi:MAG: amidohydrolase, partial [Firmicutes bacterium]|nr:amidohydrolase [Bacillota bacterium]
MRAEKLFINGNIYTMDDEKTHAEALATTGQMILAVGSTVELMDLVGPDTDVIDLKGKTVIPGLIDNHIHSMGMGRMVDQDRVIQCFDKSKEEILEAVRKAVKQREPGQWIQGMGWNQSGWLDSSMPTRQDLDDVAPENPVVLQRVCGHAIWVNSMALKLAGITRDSVAPAGSEILKDENGEPTGYLTETAGNDVQNCIPATDLDEMECSYRLIQDEMVKHGITAYTDKLLGCKAIADEPHVKDHLNLLDQLYAQRKMKIRLHTFCPPCDDLYELYKKGPQIGLYDGRLTHRGLKLYSDGALGARSAWLLEPYNDRPGHTGSGRMTDEYLQSEMKKAHDAGFQVSLHAIGDAAVKQAI